MEEEEAEEDDEIGPLRLQGQAELTDLGFARRRRLEEARALTP
jgi:hypothetical protein